MTDKIRVAVLYGGISAEHEVSVVSARCVLEAIDRDKYEVLPIAITKQGTWLLPAHTPDELTIEEGTLPGVGESDGEQVALQRVGSQTTIQPVERTMSIGAVDVVFPVLHGPGGEDGTVQGMLETLGVPYVGAGVAASAVGMDKSLQKPVFASAGIPVTRWVTIRQPQFLGEPQLVAHSMAEGLGLPCFTKPAALGSSVGVSKCRSEEEIAQGLRDAFERGPAAIVEEAIEGRELECAVLGNEDPEASVVGEIVPANEFYDYEAKYLIEGSSLIIPADVGEQRSERIRRYALDAFRAIGCEGMARVDFFLRGDDEILLNEINTIPGFTPISMYPKLWEASGIPYAKLIDRLLELALERHGRRA